MRKRLVVAMGLAAVLAMVPSAALAYLSEIQPQGHGFWAEVEAQQHCEVNEDGERVYTLYYAMRAWNREGLPPDHRVNGQISLRVTDQADPDDEILMDWGVGYLYPQNHYRFKGRHELDVDEPHTLMLRVRAEQRWGPRQEDDDEKWTSKDNGETRYLTVAPPAGCPGASPSSSTLTPPDTMGPPAAAEAVASNPECGLPGGTWTDVNGDPPVYTPGTNYSFVIPGPRGSGLGRVIYQGDNLPGDGLYDVDDRRKQYPDGHADHVDVDGDDYDDSGRNTGRRPCTATPPPPTTVAPPPTTVAPAPTTAAPAPATVAPPPATTAAPPGGAKLAAAAAAQSSTPSTTTPPGGAEFAAAAVTPSSTPSTAAPPGGAEFAAAAVTPSSTPSGGNELPFTGSRSTAAPLIAGLSLLLLGYLALRITRRGAGAHLRGD